MTDSPVVDDRNVTLEELQLAARNHGMPLEGLRYDVTPAGMHYLLIHFDVPETRPDGWRLAVDGHVRSALDLGLQDLQGRETVTRRVTLECAGNGRARLAPRPLSQPWLLEAVGNAEWTGTPLAPLLEEAGLEDDAVDLVFTGADHGLQGDVEQDYQRSLSVEDAMHPDVMLVWAMNGQPLLPQHGAPLRLLVPGWYGMTSVKWLTRIEAVPERFEGFQMLAYRKRDQAEDEGIDVTRMFPRSLMIPPGFPEFFTRTRIVDAGEIELTGRAWSGWGRIVRVDVSADGGMDWRDATLGEQPTPTEWVPWRVAWQAEPGTYELVVRATDDAGNVQPLEQSWNHHGFENNAVQRVPVTVRPGR
jgi:DMSO/TMAO reductase YedYZ molybdopterin-dependent catalytic subunit